MLAGASAPFSVKGANTALGARDARSGSRATSFAASVATGRAAVAATAWIGATTDDGAGAGTPCARRHAR